MQHDNLSLFIDSLRNRSNSKPHEVYNDSILRTFHGSNHRQRWPTKNSIKALYKWQRNKILNRMSECEDSVFGSKVDVTNRRDDNYPQWRYVDGYEFVMESGDILYNSPFCRHRILNLSHNVSIGLRWNNFCAVMNVSATQNIFSFLATKPSIISAA